MSDENDKSVEPIVLNDLGVPVELADEGFSAEEDANLGIKEMVNEQDSEAEGFAIAFLIKVIRLRGVRIDRAQFLRAELHKRGVGPVDIDKAVTENPAAAGVSPVMLDDIAQSAIDFETGKSTALSFVAGLPGGFAMIGTVPGDITQFYVHSFRVMQKIAYVYGWQSFLSDIEDVDDETLGKLAAFLGVMMGVGGASASVSLFAVQVVRPAVQKKIASVALTKTAWYVPMKQTLRIIGVQVTKQSFAKTVSKVVPVVGGVVSGGLTFVTLGTQSKRLMKYLRELPPPNVDATVYLATVKRADEIAPNRTEVFAAGIVDVSSTFKERAASAADKLRSVEILSEGFPDVSQAVAKTKRLGRSLAGTAGTAKAGFTGLLKAKRKKQLDEQGSSGGDCACGNDSEPLAEE